MSTLSELIRQNLGPLLISFLAVVLAALAMYYFLRLERLRLKFEKERFAAESQFRQQEYDRFRDEPARDLARHVAELLREHPDWAQHALEAANLTSYTHTIFGERSHHFKEEKTEIANRFSPYLLDRCAHLIDGGQRHVYLLIDAGTTLYPFFQLIGQQTAQARQRGEDWVKYFHLATNNLPGLEQLMKWGRRVSYDRYSPLAIEDCHLLPGIPMPVFAAVAGRETEKAIAELRANASSEKGSEAPVFVALVVGNWVRIRRTEPRCPVPMARGAEHCHVKNSLVESADEVYVVSPLAKNFVGQSHESVNRALGFDIHAKNPEKTSYEEVKIDSEKARCVKLITTHRDASALLYRHSVALEAALSESGVSGRSELIGSDTFKRLPIDKVPHLFFEFRGKPRTSARELEMEFPHYHTRRSREFTAMFQVNIAGGGSSATER